MNPDLVSVYLPTFNRCQLLQRAVYSVLAQTYTNFELIIVDDRSTDGTRQFLEAIQRADPRVKCVFKDDPTILSGVQSSRNIAITMAKGKYITGLDDDDFFHPERIEILEKSYQPNFSFFASNFLKYNNGKVRKNSKISRKIETKNLAIINTVGNQVFTETYKIKTVGMFDAGLLSSQDLDLWIRLIKTFGPAMRIQDYLYYVDVGHSLGRISGGEGRATGDRQFIEKHPDLINGNILTFKTDRIGSMQYGLHQGIMHSLLNYGWKVSFERARCKYGFG